jgi:hypothetical protein
MATVGYLLGAGASAECLPVVNAMAQDLAEMASNISSIYTRFDDTVGYYVKHDEGKSTKVGNMLNELAEICKNHYSIDTYAKKLFLTDVDAFKRLKLDLSLYFTLKQTLTTADRRYDNFFSSILNKDLQLPSKIKVISWNYDFQIEKSYLEFNRSQHLNSSRSWLGLSVPSEWSNHSKYTDKFNILKLNGSARIKTNNYDGYLVTTANNSERSSTASGAIDIYLNVIEGNVPFECELKFAWENEHYAKLFDSAIDLSKISVLVIIGYSFPFFNREVDVALFSKMTHLTKIYIQDTNPENIIETMSEFLDLSGSYKGSVEVVAKRNLNQFVFPKELDILS